MGEHERSTAAVWPVGGGALGALIRAHDWATTPCGPSDRWPPSLRTAVELTLASGFPTVLTWGPEHTVCAYNAAYRSLLGRKPEALGRPFLGVWAEARTAIAPQIERARAGETVICRDAPFTLLRHDAPEEASFDYCFSPVRDEAGAVAGILNVAFETTARREAEAALRAGTERQAFLLALADRVRAVTDPRAIMAEAAAALGRHLGADRVGYAEIDDAGTHFTVQDDWTSGDMPSLAGRHMLDDFGPGLIDALRGGRTVAFADHGAHPLTAGAGPAAAYATASTRAAITAPLLQGGRFAAALYAHQRMPRAWTDAEEALVLEVAERTRDAVERARAEAALRASEARFRGFAEASVDTLWIVDAANGQLVDLSPAFEAMFGAPRATIARDLATWGELVHPDDRTEATRALPHALAGAVTVVEYRILRSTDGATRWIRDTGFPIRDAAGVIRWIGGIARDVTDQQRAEDELARLLAAERDARGHAETAVRARDTFLAIAAHELRTPITALKGLSQILLRQQARGTLDPDRLARTLHGLDRSANRLVTLTGDLLDVARLRTGQLPLDPRPTDAGVLVAEAVTQARTRAEAGLRLTLDTPATLPLVLADEARIEQVLTNLLDNAVKYSPAGGTIVVALRTADAGVAISVRDDGIGLPPGTEEAIFAPFGRAENAAASSLPGMGLGLSICRSIVERHGGWIRAASAGEGRGTTVTFWLPAAEPPGDRG